MVRTSNPRNPQILVWGRSAAVLVLVALAAEFAAEFEASARDIGVVGPVHPIAEPDMLEDIQARLRAKQAAGELERLQLEAQRRARQRIETPEPVAGIGRVLVPRTYRFDPSVRFDEAITDDKGRVVVPAGALANPLSVVSLRSALLLFDSRDPAQVKRARAEIRASREPITPILVGGSPMALMREWDLPVYFDQGGRIVHRLGVAAVPAKVTQEGRLLLVQEFLP